MFVDYIALTYLIPPTAEHPKKLPPGHVLADQLVNRITVCGELRVNGATHQVVANYPTGTLIKLDFGGSVLPIDLHDFVRWLRLYRGWTVSRLDLADNVQHATRAQVKVGQARHVRWFTEHSGEGGKISCFTGVTLGKRGGCGSYYRLYDARKHVEGRVAKLAKFGTADFWRTEFEFSREWLRRRAINTAEQLTVEKLLSIWSTECHGKGLQYDSTAEYVNLRPPRPESDVEVELKQDRRVTAIAQMVRKLELGNLHAVMVDVCELARRARAAGLDAHEPVVPNWDAVP